MNAGLSHLYKSWTPTAINHFFQNQKVKIDHDPSRQPYTTSNVISCSLSDSKK